MTLTSSSACQNLTDLAARPPTSAKQAADYWWKFFTRRVENRSEDDAQSLVFIAQHKSPPQVHADVTQATTAGRRAGLGEEFEGRAAWLSLMRETNEAEISQSPRRLPARNNVTFRKFASLSPALESRDGLAGEVLPACNVDCVQPSALAEAPGCYRSDSNVRTKCIEALNRLINFGFHIFSRTAESYQPPFSKLCGAAEAKRGGNRSKTGSVESKTGNQLSKPAAGG